MNTGEYSVDPGLSKHAENKKKNDINDRLPRASKCPHVAKPNEHGHAMTRTLTALTREKGW